MQHNQHLDIIFAHPSHLIDEDSTVGVGVLLGQHVDVQLGGGPAQPVAGTGRPPEVSRVHRAQELLGSFHPAIRTRQTQG